MLFNTFEFWLFFLPVLIGTHVLPHRGQNLLLLAASYVFYGAWDARFLSLIVLSTLVDYYVAPLAAPGNRKKMRQRAVLASVIVNLGILGLFKYHDFFVTSFVALLGLDPGSADPLLLNVILPVGISFYTFQTMSYTLDVYAGRIDPVRRLDDFALYVAFFPQLVAGPIERGSRLVPQVVQPRRLSSGNIESACHLIAWGLFKKVVVADTLAHAVNTIFASANPTGPEVYVATIAFAIQIYGDFSGYSDIARGLGRLLGFDLMVNFNFPYFSRNPPEFWRRWHISLSSWLRDYLYIPLGGNRRGTGRLYANLAITMVLGGLWHGARMNFVLWGAYQGAILILHRLVSGDSNQPVRDGAFTRCFKTLGMFHLVLGGWLLFRVESMDQLGGMLAALCGSWSWWGSAGSVVMYALPVLVPLVLYELVAFAWGRPEMINSLRWPFRAMFFGFCVSAVLLLNRGAAVPFIYFQF